MNQKYMYNTVYTIMNKVYTIMNEVDANLNP